MHVVMKFVYQENLKEANFHYAVFAVSNEKYQNWKCFSNYSCNIILRRLYVQTFLSGFHEPFVNYLTETITHQISSGMFVLSSKIIRRQHRWSILSSITVSFPQTEQISGWKSAFLRFLLWKDPTTVRVFYMRDFVLQHNF